VRVSWQQTGWETSQEEEMAKPRRWNGEKRYQIVKEALSQKEPMGQVARRHQVSEGLIYRPDKFFEAAKAALAFDGHR
jgi:transposase-like protein